MGYHQDGAVCCNGHWMSLNIENADPGEFCKKCGAAGVRKCAHCNHVVHGSYHTPGVVVFGGSRPAPDSFCYHCGNPYPWMTANFEGARELADAIEELSDHERTQLAEFLPHLTQDTPRTQAAAFKSATIIAKIKSPAGAVLYDLFVSLATDAAKKALGAG